MGVTVLSAGSDADRRVRCDQKTRREGHRCGIICLALTQRRPSPCSCLKRVSVYVLPPLRVGSPLQALLKGRLQRPPRHAAYEEAVEMFFEGEGEMDELLIVQSLIYKCTACGAQFATYQAFDRHRLSNKHGK